MLCVRVEYLHDIIVDDAHRIPAKCWDHDVYYDQVDLQTTISFLLTCMNCVSRGIPLLGKDLTSSLPTVTVEGMEGGKEYKDISSTESTVLGVREAYWSRLSFVELRPFQDIDYPMT